MSLDYGPSLCSTTEYNLTEPTDGSGNFSVNFTNIVNFDRTAYATVYARDTNGNSTFNDFYPYQIYTMFGSTWSDGYLKPNVSFTAV